MRFRLLPLMVLAPVAAAGADGADTPGTSVTFVANAENQTKPRVRYAGRPWTADAGGFLVGSGRGQRLLAETAPREGDFRVEWELALPRSGRESVVAVGAAGEIAIASGTTRWQIRGRFFRTGDRSVEVKVPEIKPGRSFSLVVERRGAEVRVAVDRQEVFHGPCSPGPVGTLGIDPDVGLVHLYTMTARGRFGAEAPPRPFGNAFGLQRRPVPREIAAVRAPVILREAPTNEASIVTRSDGTLEIYSITKPESDSVSVIRSRDGGLTWGAPEIAFRIPGRAYYAIVVLEAADGSLHAVYHVLGDGPGGYRGRLYEVYHTRRPAGAREWAPPLKVVPGYVGSINGFIQRRASGRLVLAVARAIPEREQPPASGPDRGWNDTFVYWSDDQGATWRQSPDVLSLVLASANVTRYGAIEPALLELREGRIWMLVRDRGGRLWQSFSPDGERWSALERTGFISSDSPADLLRLRDGRIVLLTNACQNWTDPRSYAMGGREVLHAAISRDEGRTWRGFREVLHETDVLTGGDRGTSYAAMTENSAGKIVAVSGQGEGKRAVFAFDPDWLEEDGATNDLDSGPVEWTQYGDDGLSVTQLADGTGALVIPLDAAELSGALWNFPSAIEGEIRMRMRVPREVKELKWCLNDHFNRIDDRASAEHAVAAVPAPAEVIDGEWHDVVLRWSEATGAGRLEWTIDGRNRGTMALQRPAQFGVNYLRVEYRASVEAGSVVIRDATMRRLR